jgi:hypothetical protein
LTRCLSASSSKSKCIDDNKKENSKRPDSRNSSASSSGINFFKESSNLNYCLGAGLNKRTGDISSDCIYITYDDFCKIISFKKYH